MNNHYTQSILKYVLLIASVLISSCGQSNIVTSPTSTPRLTKTPTNTATPESTGTPEVVYPEGDLIYSTMNGVFSFSFQSKESKIISSADKRQGRLFVVNNSIYMLRDISGNAIQFEIFKMNLDGSNLIQLTSDGNKFSFAVSPNEDYITYSPEINEMSLYDLKTGGSQIVIEKSGYAFTVGTWSPDGRMFVFSETEWPPDIWGDNFLYTMNSRISTKLLPNELGIEVLGYESQPAWSPDGKHLILNLTTDLQSGYPDVYILSVESGDLQKIAPGMSGESFAWSPDGNMILFKSRTNPRKLYRFNLSNRELEPIEEGGADFNFYYPMWSPKGDYFAYFTEKADAEWYLNIQNMSTREKLKIAFPEGVLSAQWIYPK